MITVKYNSTKIVEESVTVPDGVTSADDEWSMNLVRTIFLALLAANHYNYRNLESDLYSESEKRVRSAAGTLNEYWEKAEAVEKAVREFVATKHNFTIP